MNKVLKYRVFLTSSANDYPTIMNGFDWMRQDRENDEDFKEAAPNSKILIKRDDEGNILAVYVNEVASDDPQEKYNQEHCNYYFSHVKTECSVHGVDYYEFNNTTSPSRERDLYDAIPDGLKQYCTELWNLIGKTPSEIESLSKNYGISGSVKEPIAPVRISDFDNEEPVVVSGHMDNKGDDMSNMGVVSKPETGMEDEDTVTIPKTMLDDILNRLKTLEDDVRVLKGSGTPEVQEEPVEIPLAPVEPVEPELTPVQEPTPIAEPEPTPIVDNTPDEEEIPLVEDPTEGPAIDETGLSDTAGLYQTAVYYPKNPVKQPRLDQGPQISETDEVIVTGDIPDKMIEKLANPSNESIEEKTVIYNSTESAEDLWESILHNANIGNESDMSDAILANYDKLPANIQSEFFEWNMFERYINNEPTPINKIESVKRKVRVQNLKQN